MLPKEKKENL